MINGAAVASEAGVANEEDCVGKPRGRPFEPGKSGNPSGRPKGSRNKLMKEMEDMLEREWEPVLYRLIDKATKGDVKALRLYLEPMFPVRRGRPVEFDLPEIKTAEDASKASSAVLDACGDATLSPAEAHEVMSLLERHVQLIESSTLEARVSALEKEQRS